MKTRGDFFDKDENFEAKMKKNVRKTENESESDLKEENFEAEENVRKVEKCNRIRVRKIALKNRKQKNVKRKSRWILQLANIVIARSQSDEAIHKIFSRKTILIEIASPGLCPWLAMTRTLATQKK